MPGFVRSIRASIGGQLLLNINTTTSAFYRAGPLLPSILDFGTHRLYDLHHFLKGVRVKTTYFSLPGAKIPKS